MADEKKTLKFQMMMSPQEAELLDDWMFENRLRSRAEAIRRLVQIGLHTDRAAEMYGEPSLELSKWITALLSEHGSESDQTIPTAKLSETSRVLVGVMVLLARAKMFAKNPHLEALLERDSELRQLVEDAEKEHEP